MPVNPETWEAEEDKWAVQDQHRAYDEFEASLGCMRPYLRRQKQNILIFPSRFSLDQKCVPRSVAEDLVPRLSWKIVVEMVRGRVPGLRSLSCKLFPCQVSGCQVSGLVLPHALTMGSYSPTVPKAIWPWETKTLKLWSKTGLLSISLVSSDIYYSDRWLTLIPPINQQVMYWRPSTGQTSVSGWRIQLYTKAFSTLMKPSVQKNLNPHFQFSVCLQPHHALHCCLCSILFNAHWKKAGACF